MSNVTPPAFAGPERPTVKLKVVVPELPSVWETSLTVRVMPVAHTFGVVARFRGVGAAAAKSAALLSVSVHPPSARKSDWVVLMVGAGPEPSKKLAPVAPVP